MPYLLIAGTSAESSRGLACFEDRPEQVLPFAPRAAGVRNGGAACNPRCAKLAALVWTRDPVGPIFRVRVLG